MIVKERTKPVSLQVLESLDARHGLTDREKRERRNHSTGYQGESAFDKLTHLLPDTCQVVNDLRLTDNGTSVQMDTLIQTGKELWIYEIKNYAGSYTYREDALYASSGFIISNPETQFRKSKPLLHNLVRKLRYPYTVKTQVVFMNPSFYLYELPQEKPFVFAGQLRQHMEQLAGRRTWLDESDKRLIRQLCDLHIADYRPPNLPGYKLADLKKGILCPKCFSFKHLHTRQLCMCACGHKETSAQAIKRSADEFRVLFPDIKMTTQLIYDWCGGVYTKQRIQMVLQQHFVQMGSRRHTYYV